MGAGTLPADGFVQVATDGVGKKVRNVVAYMQQADGSVVPVYSQVVTLADGNGNVIDFDGENEAITRRLDRIAELLETLIELQSS